MSQENVGFIGLGNLGKAMAANIASGGFEMCVFDILGAEERAPAGASVGESVGEVAERSSLIFLCLPTIESIETVVGEICEADVPQGSIVVTGTYATEGTIDISRKDIGLFVDEAKAAGCRHVVAECAYNVIKECQEQAPGTDQTMMYPFTRDGGKVSI
tara:strand:- start:12322 stop:12798 length:477 start_codon:yes stop_codon:yes gene_type:complete